MEHEIDGNTNCIWRARYSNQRNGTGTGGLENKSVSEDHPSNIIVEIDWNTKKSPGDVVKLVVTQTPEENYRLTLV